MKTVVGLFDDMDQARKAAMDLEASGILHDDISIVANNEGGKYAPADSGTTSTEHTGHAIGHDAIVGAEIGGVAGLLMAITGFAIPGLGWIAGAGWLMATILGAGTGAVIGGVVGALTHVGVPEEDAAHYNEGVRRGGTLLAVRAQDEAAHKVAQILGDDGAVDIDERAAQYKQDGFLPSPAVPLTNTPASTAPAVPAVPATAYGSNVNREGETVLPVVAEELEVGKREVQRGGVRVYTHVTEQPVQEQVNLREEHVNVERRPVDRPIAAGDAAAFQEGKIEVREMAEEAVIAKEARVVEEVVVGKQVTDRTQVVQDTVRRTDVEVESLPGSQHTGRPGLADGIQTGGRTLDGSPDTRGVTEKAADAVTGDRTDDKTGRPV